MYQTICLVLTAYISDRNTFLIQIGFVARFVVLSYWGQFSCAGLREDFSIEIVEHWRIGTNFFLKGEIIFLFFKTSERCTNDKESGIYITVPNRKENVPDIVIMFFLPNFIY